jgi:predicted PurR-regulated permease PerM
MAHRLRDEQARGVRVLTSAASLVIVVAGLRAGASLLIPLVFALFLAVLCYPSVQTLQRWRVPGAAAVGLTVVAVLALLTGPGLLVAAAVRQFISAVPAYQERLGQIWVRSLDWLRGYNIDTEFLASYADPTRALEFVVNALSGVVTLLSVSFVVVFVAAFMLLEGAHRAGQPAVPGKSGQNLARIIREMQIYLQVKTLVSLGTGLAAGLWVAVLGVDFALLWALTAFLLNYIPNIGSIAAAVPPALVALIQFGPTYMVLVLAGYVAINATFGTLLEPYLLGRQLKVSPLAVFTSVIVWGWIWGLAGALLAMPMTMALKIVLEQSEDLKWVAKLLEGPGSEESPGSP